MHHVSLPLRVAAVFACLCLGSMGLSANPLQCAPGAVPGAGQCSVVPCDYEGGGRFTSIAVDPRNPRIVLVGSDVAGVFKSEDGGRSFQLKGRGLEGFSVADIVIHPDDPLQVFLLAGDGLYLSNDRGEHWQKKSAQIRYDSRQLGRQLMLLADDRLWVATDRNGVFQVELSDRSWSAIQYIGLQGMAVNCLARYQNVMHAATDQGVFRYRDGAWQPCNQGLDRNRQNIMNIVSHPAGRFYLVEKTSGLHVWVAEAGKWEERKLSSQQMFLDRPRSFKTVAVDPRNPDVVFLATHPESWPHLLYKSNDGGRSWNRVDHFTLAPEAAPNWAKSLSNIEEIEFSPDDARQLYLTDWSNLWQSTDGGEGWLQVHQGLLNTVINDIKIDSNDPAKLYLAVADNGLMVSDNGGRTWNRKMQGVLDGHAQEIELSRQDPSRMYLLMNPWLKKDKIFVYSASDGGNTWRDISFPVPSRALPGLGYVDGLATSLEIDPTADHTVYVGTNGYGVFKTSNGGRSWKTVNSGLDTPYLKGPGALAIHPRNSQMLYAATLQGGVFKTTDGGNNWSNVTRQCTFTFAVALCPANPSRVLVACAEKKILISEDAGETWKLTRLPGENPVHIASYALAFHPLYPQWFFVGTLAYDFKAADGLFLSQDGGQTFAKCPLDLPRVNINSIAFQHASPWRMFLGFNGIGLFEGRLTGSDQ